MSRLQGRHVLIVEDEALIACLYQDVLEDQGCIVLGPATTVPEALAMVRQGPSPDAVILDLNLRGAVSWPVADLLAERRIPFVIASGYGGMDPAREASATAVIAKPVSPQRLLEAVKKAVEAGVK